MTSPTIIIQNVKLPKEIEKDLSILNERISTVKCFRTIAVFGYESGFVRVFKHNEEENELLHDEDDKYEHSLLHFRLCKSRTPFRVTSLDIIDESLVAAGCYDGSCSIYSIYSNNEEKHSASYPDPIDFICLDPRRLISGNSDLAINARNEFAFAVITGGRVLMNTKGWFGSSKSEEIQAHSNEKLLGLFWMRDNLLWGSTAGVKIFDTNKKSVFYFLPISPSMNIGSKSAFSFTPISEGCLLLCCGKWFCSLTMDEFTIDPSPWKECEMSILKAVKHGGEKEFLFLLGEANRMKRAVVYSFSLNNFFSPSISLEELDEDFAKTKGEVLACSFSVSHDRVVAYVVIKMQSDLSSRVKSIRRKTFEDEVGNMIAQSRYEMAYSLLGKHFELFGKENTYKSSSKYKKEDLLNVWIRDLVGKGEIEEAGRVLVREKEGKNENDVMTWVDLFKGNLILISKIFPVVFESEASGIYLEVLNECVEKKNWMQLETHLARWETSLKRMQSAMLELEGTLQNELKRVKEAEQSLLSCIGYVDLILARYDQALVTFLKLNSELSFRLFVENKVSFEEFLSRENFLLLFEISPSLFKEQVIQYITRKVLEAEERESDAFERNVLEITRRITRNDFVLSFLTKSRLTIYYRRLNEYSEVKNKKREMFLNNLEIKYFGLLSAKEREAQNYDGNFLLSLFSNSSFFYDKQEALKHCRDNKLHRECVSLLSSLEDAKDRKKNLLECFTILVEDLRDVKGLMDLAEREKERGDVWDEVVELMFKKDDDPMFVSSFLHLLCEYSIDPIKVVRAMPNDLLVPNLSLSLVKVFQRLKSETNRLEILHEVFVSDFEEYLKGYVGSKKRGLRVSLNGRRNEHCQLCFYPLCLSDDDLVVFKSGDAYHLSCIQTQSKFISNTETKDFSSLNQFIAQHFLHGQSVRLHLQSFAIQMKAKEEKRAGKGV